MTIKRRLVALFLALVVASTASAQQTSLQIDHVAIYVADLKTSVDFYHDVLGFQRVPMPVTFAAWLSMGNGVMLHVVAGRKEPVSNSKWDHLSFACDDMEKMTNALDAKRVHWESMEGKACPAVRFDGVKQIFIKDPDGYWIEINDAAKKK
jgi:lactoylglutathione lyase